MSCPDSPIMVVVIQRKAGQGLQWAQRKLPQCPKEIDWSTTIMGLSGWAKHDYVSHPLSCNWDPVLFSQEFLIVPDSPSPLLGRDILSKVQDSVFMNMEPAFSLSLIEQNVNPKVWADQKIVGWAQNAVPVFIKLKDPHLFSHQKQYPLKPK